MLAPAIEVLITSIPFFLEVSKNAWEKYGSNQGTTVLPDGTVVLKAPKADGPIPPLLAGWERWHGARPELRGAPEDTILNFKGLSTTTPAFRAGFLDVCERLGIPVDSMAMVCSHESGFNPAALNPLPAAGIFQLTVGANLKGYTTSDAIRAIAKLSAVEQLPILEAYYARTGSKYKGANPGQLLLANFLPAFYGKPEDFVLANIPPELNVGFTSAQLKQVQDDRAAANQPFTKEEGYYIWNPGMDVNRDGMITVEDVYEGAAAVCAGPKGQRMRVDGSTFTPGEGVA